MAKIRDLYDDFNLPRLDTAKWDPASSGQITLLPSGGVTLGRGLAANAYTVLKTRETFDLKDSSTYIRVDQMVSGGSSSGSMLVQNDAGLMYGFLCTGTLLQFITRDATGATTQYLATINFNLSEHRWWRMTSSSKTGQTMWQTSRDGSSWTTRFSKSNSGKNESAMRVVFEVGYWDGAQPGSGSMGVKYIGTKAPINRGPGILTDTFESYPEATWPLYAQFGPWQTIDSLNGSNVRTSGVATSNLVINPAFTKTDGTVTLRTNLVTHPSTEAVGTPTASRTNLCINPSFESNLNKWYTWAGNAGNSVASRKTTGGYSGNSYMSSTWVTGGTSNGGNYMTTEIQMTPGEVYTASAYVRPSKTQSMLASFEWVNAAGAHTSITNGTPSSVTANTWDRISVTATVPAGAVTAVVTFYSNGGSTWSAGNKLDTDAVLIEKSAVLGTYFDGSSETTPQYTNFWNGSANASTSTVTTTPVTGWTGSGTGSGIFSTSVQKKNGTRSIYYTAPTSNTANSGVSKTVSGLTIGKEYTASAYIYQPALFSSTGAQVGVSQGGVWSNSTRTTTLNSWVRKSVTFTATATSVTLFVGSQGTTYPASGAELYVDSAMLEEGAVLNDYFDGSTSTTSDFLYEWTGTEHASTSRIAGKTLVGVTSDESEVVSYRISDALATDGYAWRTVVTNPTSFGADSDPAPASMPVGRYTLVVRARANATRKVSPRIAGTLGNEVTLGTSWKEFRVSLDTSGMSGGTGLVGTLAGGWVAGDTLDIDYMMVVESDYTGKYFDGSTKNSAGIVYGWTGEAGNSISELRRVSNKILRLTAPLNTIAMAHTNLSSPVREVDFEFDAKFVARHGSEDYDLPRFQWRIKSYDTYYQIQFGPLGFNLIRVVDGKQSFLGFRNIGTRMGVNYRWRVVHAGGTVIIYRNAGDVSTVGRVTRPIEVMRLNEDVINGAGQVGFFTQSCDIEVDNVVIKNATTPLALRTGFPMYARKHGIFAAETPVGGSQPESFLNDMDILYNLEAAVEKKFDTASIFQNWDEDFYSDQVAELAAGGRNVLISWRPEGRRQADVLEGDYDDYILKFAKDALDADVDVYLRLMPEMNGFWEPWSRKFLEGTGDFTLYDPAVSCEISTAAEYRAMWRYIVTKFREVNTKAKFVFCPNVTDEPRDNALEDYYAGDQYVDVLAFDGYNFGTPWLTHTNVLDDIYYRVAGLHPSKPVWICETGSREPSKAETPSSGGATVPIDSSQSKGKWVTDFLNEQGYSRIEEINWFHIDKERDWRLTSSEASRSAFAVNFNKVVTSGPGAILDPELNPQVAPEGYAPTNAVSQVEYMRLTEDGFRDLVISPSYGGIWLLDFDPGFGTVREVLESRALGDGSRDFTSLFGPKAVGLTVLVKADEHADAPYYTDLITRFCAPTRRPTMVYKLRGQVEKTVRLRASQLSKPITREGKDSLEVNLQFVAYDGKDYGTEEKNLTLTSGQPALEAVSYGTSTTEPVIRIYGPCVNPIVFNDTIEAEGTQARLGFTMTIPAGQYIELDSKERTVQLNGWLDESASRRQDLTTRRWFTISPFRNFLRMTSDDGNGTAEVIWRDAY